MEQVTNVTGSRHMLSTPRTRAAARDRAARLGRFETAALKAAQGARVRISTSKATPYVLATALMLAGSIEPR